MTVWEGLNPPYSTIVADPPWHYPDGPRCMRTNEKAAKGHRSVADRGYSGMTVAELEALPVVDLAARDAHLYLWTTNRFVEAAHAIARSWGFTPKTMLTWGKVHHDDPARPSMTVGYWFRSASEHVVFATRGSVPRQTSEGVPTLMLWPRIDAHSVKPAAFGDLVERVSPGPYVELFARAPRLGWDSWGKGYESGAA